MRLEEKMEDDFFSFVVLNIIDVRFICNIYFLRLVIKGMNRNNL